MDMIYFLASINKLSLFAFLLTLGVLLYEVHLFRKEAQRKVKPVIPQFQEKVSYQAVQGRIIETPQTENIRKPNNTLLIVLVVLMVMFGLATFIGFFSLNRAKTKATITPAPTTDFVTSKGIRILDDNFQAIPDGDLTKIKSGQAIIIGVETITDLVNGIDRARIRVNRDNWRAGDITERFYDKLKIYYIRYLVATGESKLKVEAQLHSVSDGWLGD